MRSSPRYKYNIVSTKTTKCLKESIKTISFPIIHSILSCWNPLIHPHYHHHQPCDPTKQPRRKPIEYHAILAEHNNIKTLLKNATQYNIEYQLSVHTGHRSIIPLESNHENVTIHHHVILIVMHHTQP